MKLIDDYFYAMNNALFLKIVVVIFALINIFLCKDFPFFWDHIALTSNFAHHFFENGIFPPIVNSSIDHGHPTFFAVYLTNCWNLLGRNLFVSHLAMFPFLLLLGFQWLKLIQYFLPTRFHLLGLLALLVEPSLLAQSTMIGTEIPLIAGVIMTLNGIIYNKNALKFFGLLLCACLSIRGGMWCVVLLITELLFLLSLRDKQASFLKNLVLQSQRIVPYFLAGLLIIAWYIYHYIATGYLLVPKNSVWASNHIWSINLNTFTYNLKILVWCIGDFGRFFYFSVLLLLILLTPFVLSLKEKLNSKKITFLLFFLLSTTIIYFPVMIFRSGNILRRYLIPFYLIALLLFLVIVLKGKKPQINYIIIGCCFTIMLTGHFWIYPEKYAQDWDASLAHLPYFDLEEKMYNYLNEYNISFEEIAVGFPTYNSAKVCKLNNDERKMNPIKLKAITSESINIKSYQEYPYVIYSNIYNILLVSQIQELRNSGKWKTIKRFENKGVYLELFQKIK